MEKGWAPGGLGRLDPGNGESKGTEGVVSPGIGRRSHSRGARAGRAHGTCPCSIGENIQLLVDRPDGTYCFRLHRDRVYYLR